MLVRTDRTVKKQAGISFLLVDCNTPGITIRDIPELAGHTALFEVTFDNVRVPVANLVGELNQGWTVAKALLGFERLMIGSPARSMYALELLTRLAEERSLFSDPGFVARYVQQQLDVADLMGLYGHFADLVKRGEKLGNDVSILKIWATETYQRTALLLLESAAEYGALLGAQSVGNMDINVPSQIFMSTSATIYGGASEIQRNIVAKQVLMLPD
jgi:alkylation response protein AidB-like acyl-CoA dehydrogenase